MHQEIKELFDLKGKVALITGGAKYLGLDAACILAAAGADIIITSRVIAQAQKSADQLSKSYGINTLALELDQTQHRQILLCVDKIQDWKGRLDILINNAGGGSGNSKANLFERDHEDINSLISTNLTGMVYCCQEFGKLMVKSKAGKIINIASIAGLLGRDRRMYERAGMLGQPVDYAAAKAGVIGLTKDLAGFLSPMGVNVNAISPGGFTSKSRNHNERFVKDYSDRTPLGRMGRDGIDLKGAVLFLSSAASDYITGHNLVVDGGFSIWH
jgi:NAD(P)-dependent dehydrogenase (short-subunit alcohol dehydrogenase family)